MHGEVLSGTRNAVIVENRVDQGRGVVNIAVEQRLYRRGGRVEQWRHCRRFVVDDLRRTNRRAVPDLVNLRRGWYRRRAYSALIAEQLVRRCLVVGAFAVVEDVLMVVSTVLAIVQRLGLAGVDLGERWLRLIMLRIAGRMLKGTAGSRGGRFARPGGGRGGRGSRTGSHRGRSRLMILYRIRQIVLVFVQATCEGDECR